MELTAFSVGVDRLAAVREQGTDVLFDEQLELVGDVTAVFFDLESDILPFLLRGLVPDGPSNPVRGGQRFDEKFDPSYYDSALCETVCEVMAPVTFAQLRQNFDPDAIIASGFGSCLEGLEAGDQEQIFDQAATRLLALRSLFCDAAAQGRSVIVQVG